MWRHAPTAGGKGIILRTAGALTPIAMQASMHSKTPITKTTGLDPTTRGTRVTTSRVTMALNKTNKDKGTTKQAGTLVLPTKGD